MGPEKILFADDSPDDRFLMMEAAKKAGLGEAIIVVNDGEEAVDYLRNAAAKKNPAPCLVILDLSMPRLTGLEALEWIRRSKEWSTLPVFILTASSQKGDAQRCYARGANAFLIKPTTLKELFEMVEGIKTFWTRFVVPPPEGCGTRGELT